MTDELNPENHESPDVQQDQPPISEAEIRYLVYMLFVELHRQRELLATIAMHVAPDDAKAKAVQQLIDAQQQQEYQIPFDFLDTEG